MKPIEWTANDTMRCRDVTVKVCEDLAPAQVQGDEQVTIFKPRRMVEEMVQVLQDADIRRMLELGMWEGGSAIFFEHHLELERFVGVDTRPRVHFLERYIDRHRLGARIRIRGSTSQSDEAALNEIFHDDFQDSEIDLVVDDASHFLDETRKSFEICFPRLRTGGLYVIEDWSWGHVATTLLPEQMPPSPLVFELLLICGSFQDIIRRIHVNQYFVVVERGEAPLKTQSANLESLYAPRGLPLPWVPKQKKA